MAAQKVPTGDLVTRCILSNVRGLSDNVAGDNVTTRYMVGAAGRGGGSSGHRSERATRQRSAHAGAAMSRARRDY